MKKKKQICNYDIVKELFFMIHVFLVGTKGIPAQYGGFETFVENLTAGKKTSEILYHVSCMNNDEKNYIYNNAECFNVRLPVPGAIGRIMHMGLVMEKIESWIKAHPDDKVLVYILGCRIGPLLIYHAKILHKLNARILCNPDGLEWKRSKWNAIEKRFLRICESCLINNSDAVICDSLEIQKYIQKRYEIRESIYIAYGTYMAASQCDEEKINTWYRKNHLKKFSYYLVVGRFVPENNYKTIIQEFMQSKSLRDLVIITNIENNNFFQQLQKETNFEKDKRIKFAGTVYDQPLLKKIREEAYGYIHGHEVGGTNPSLLESLSCTKLCLLLDVGFNREVALNGGLYWTKEEKSLANLIDYTDWMNEEEKLNLFTICQGRMRDFYSWDKICEEYERTFLR